MAVNREIDANGHTHDGRYYTEAEVDALLLGVGGGPAMGKGILPAAGDDGRLWWDTGDNISKRDNGTIWENIPVAWAAVAGAPASFPPSTHTHPASQVTAGTFPDSYTFAGTLRLPLGSGADPAIAFTADPTTGIFSPGAGAVRHLVGGVVRLRLDGTGAYIGGTFEGDGSAIFAQDLTLGHNVTGALIKAGPVGGGGVGAGRLWLSLPDYDASPYWMEYTSRAGQRFRVDSNVMGPLTAMEISPAGVTSLLLGASVTGNLSHASGNFGLNATGKFATPSLNPDGDNTRTLGGAGAEWASVAARLLVQNGVTRLNDGALNATTGAFSGLLSANGGLAVTGHSTFTHSTNVATMNITGAAADHALITAQRAGVTQFHIGIDPSSNFAIYNAAASVKLLLLNPSTGDATFATGNVTLNTNNRFLKGQHTTAGVVDLLGINTSNQVMLGNNQATSVVYPAKDDGALLTYRASNSNYYFNMVAYSSGFGGPIIDMQAGAGNARTIISQEPTALRWVDLSPSLNQNMGFYRNGSSATGGTAYISGTAGTWNVLSGTAASTDYYAIDLYMQGTPAVNNMIVQRFLQGGSERSSVRSKYMSSGPDVWALQLYSSSAGVPSENYRATPSQVSLYAGGVEGHRQTSTAIRLPNNFQIVMNASGGTDKSFAYTATAGDRLMLNASATPMLLYMNAAAVRTGGVAETAGDTVFPQSSRLLVSDAGFLRTMIRQNGTSAGGTGYIQWGDTSQDNQWGPASVAIGAGALITLGRIGGSGPATAAQNSWLKIRDNAGNARFIPVWA